MKSKLLIMNPISFLQEYCQKSNIPMPKYDLTDHKVHLNSTSFTIRVTIGSLKAHGVASNKKEAKCNAAKDMIRLMNLNRNNDIIDTTPHSSSSPHSPNTSLNTDSSNGSLLMTDGNYVGKLQDFCVQYKYKIPTYEWDINYFGAGHKLICRLGNLSKEAIAPNKKTAKQACAEQMWQHLMGIDSELRNTQQKSNEKDSTSGSVDSLSCALDKLDITTTISASNLQSSIEKAKLICLSQQKGVVSDPKKIPIKDYHSSLRNLLTADTLQKISEYSNGLTLDVNHGVEIYENKLKEICSLLNVNFEEKMLSSVKGNKVIVAYTINTEPSYTGVGIGPYYEVAKINALFDSIKAIHEILQ